MTQGKVRDLESTAMDLEADIPNGTVEWFHVTLIMLLCQLVTEVRNLAEGLKTKDKVV